MTSFERGDVVLVRFPHSDLQGFTHRPALVVQSSVAKTNLAQRIVALITSNLQRTGETRVLVKLTSPAGKAMGVLTDSMIVLDNLATIRDDAIFRRIGRLEDQAEVDAALRLTLGL